MSPRVRVPARVPGDGASRLRGAAGRYFPVKNPGTRPYTRGFHAAWVGTWGPIGDGHSRLGRLALRIEKEILDDLGPSLTPLVRRRVKHVAALGALCEMTRKTFGIDPKSTRRAVSVAARTFANELARLRALVPGVPETPEQAFAARVRGNRANGARS